MSKIHSYPDWFNNSLNINDELIEGKKLTLNNQKFIFSNGILRSQDLYSSNQTQTKDTFSFKWKKTDTYEDNLTIILKDWLNEKYGKAENYISNNRQGYLLLDAGCGSGVSGLGYFSSVKKNIKYVGADISEAIDVAKIRMKEKNFDGNFIQCDLMNLPFKKSMFDIIFSEGVLHHTDNTELALKALCTFLKVNGLIMFYVYKKKAPIREFVDDHIREQIQDLEPLDAWNKLKPLSKLGKTLGDLNIEIDIKESIDLLKIPSGKINLQRLFYWYIFKAFYKSNLSIEEMNHVNYDWYAPKNARRHSLNEVRNWCKNIGLSIKREHVCEAGITIIASKLG